MMQGPPDLAPIFSFGGMADQVGAISLSYGILMALWERARTGKGQEVEASLMGGQVMLQSFNITSTIFTGRVLPRRSREEAQPLWNVYRCRDGGYVALSMSLVGRWWGPFCEATNRLDLLEDARFGTSRGQNDHKTELIGILDEMFATRDQWDWVNDLCGRGLAVAPVQDYAQVIEDPQVVANDYIVPFTLPDGTETSMVGPAVQMGGSPGSIRRRAPEFGEHTEEVLLENGFTWEEIAALKDSGAIGGR
jgi:crotonobetainyl-CoA:carnitine CoA-transferase CaiB-like acyl-CoA transferase